MKKTFYTILFFTFGILIFSQNASASILSVGSSTVSAGTAIARNNGGTNPIFTTYFTATSSGFLSYSELYGYTSGNSNPEYYVMVDKCYGSPCSAFPTPINFTTSTLTEVWPIPSTGITKKQYFDEEFLIEAGSEYRVRFYSTDLSCSAGCGTTFAGEYGQSYDVFLNIYSDTEYTPPQLSGSVDFVSPLYGRTYAQSFGFAIASTTFLGNYFENGNLTLVLSTSSLVIAPFSTPNAYIVNTVPVRSGVSVQTRIPITKSMYLNGSSTHWYGYLILYNNDFSDYIGQKTIEFNISSDINFNQETALERLFFDLEDCSAYEGNFFSSSTLGGLSCSAGNFIKKTANFFITAGDKVTSFFGNLIISTFPINIFYHINKDFSEAIQNASTTPAQEIVLGNGDERVFGGRSYNILTSSTMDTVAGNIGFDYKTILDYVLYALTGGLMIFLSMKTLGKMHSGQSQQIQKK